MKSGRRVGRQAATMPRHASAVDQMVMVPRDPDEVDIFSSWGI